jgi:AraC family transcriptional regulator of adaptative response/methylated-DNA-[protein]-cysteine methyltransferase
MNTAMNNAAAQAGSKITANEAERYWRATLARDARADGTFILGVLSTRIYCRPSCPARRPLRRNVVFFGSGEEAEKQGFRPCLRCKPNERSGALQLVERAARELAGGEEEIFRVATLAEKGNEACIHDCEITDGKSFGGGYGKGCFGGLFG